MTSKTYSTISALCAYVSSFIVIAAVLAAHAYGLVFTPGEYEAAPPTVSRLLVDPVVAGPFALAMIVAALFLTFAVLRIVATLSVFISLGAGGRRIRWALLAVMLVSELVAIAGMIVLSQYTGGVDSRMHDRGSYMLFFGHAIGIASGGYLVRLLMGELEEKFTTPFQRFMFDRLRPLPRRATWVALLSVSFGVVYFGGKLLPESCFFVQRAVLSGLEVVVLFAFLFFLMSFGPILARADRLQLLAEPAPSLEDPVVDIAQQV